MDQAPCVAEVDREFATMPDRAHRMCSTLVHSQTSLIDLCLRSTAKKLWQQTKPPKNISVTEQNSNFTRRTLLGNSRRWRRSKKACLPGNRLCLDSNRFRSKATPGPESPEAPWTVGAHLAGDAARAFHKLDCFPGHRAETEGFLGFQNC